MFRRHFENLFFTDDLEGGIRGVLAHVCEFIGYTRGFVCCIDEEKDEVRLFTVYLPAAEVSMFPKKKYSITEAANQAWYKAILASRRGEVFDLDFSQPADCVQARELFPNVMMQKEKFDIRGIHVQYLEINGKPWGYVGFIRQYADSKVLSENEKQLLKMASNIIELAVTRKRSFVNLRNAMDQANAAAEAKSRFLATMSHEIRTPLNAVIGFASLLSEPSLDRATHNEYLKNISEAGNALLELINDILDISKLSARKMEFSPVKVSVLDLVSKIGVSFMPKCKQKGLHFMGLVRRDFPMVWIDVQRVRQILFNLIGNAVKFTDAGTIKVRAEFVKETPEEGTLILSVADTGIGISEADQTRLFQPFSQASAIRGTQTAKIGTGLGLAICKQLLECMDGELTLVSKPDEGSTFAATLHHVKYDQTSTQAEMLSAEIPNQKKLRDFSKCSVLVVDDVRMNLMVMKALLKKLAVKADTAESAASAWDMIARKHYDCVLTDLWMPGLNGVELAEKIRRELQEKAPKIAVVTADVEGRDHFDFSVFDGVLLKPVTPLSLQMFFEKASL